MKRTNGLNFITLLLSGLLLVGCEAKSQKPDIIVTFDEYEEWEDWKRDQDEQAKAEAFEPIPISVSGIGKARGKPDIAVLTGIIKTVADFDHLAMDEASVVMNKVQDSVRGAKVDLSFTQVSTREVRDPKCLEANRYARQRHRDIVRDNQFNAWLKRQPKENKQKPRKPRDRIAEKTCPITHVEGYVRFTAWVQPVDEAGDYINIFTTAGVDEVDLFGYDFTNYDELYKAAARDAVLNAKAKAELAARTAGTQLTTLEQFSVGPTQRTTRYGQQAMIISNHGNRSVAQRKYSGTQDQVMVTGSRLRKETFTSASPVQSYSSGYVNTQGMSDVMPAPPPVAAFSCWDGSMVLSNAQCPGQPVATSTSQYATSIPQNSSPQSVPQNNALRMTLMSGSQTITVRAQMAFSYETPLNGKVILYDN